VGTGTAGGCVWCAPSLQHHVSDAHLPIQPPFRRLLRCRPSSRLVLPKPQPLHRRPRLDSARLPLALPPANTVPRSSRACACLPGAQPRLPRTFRLVRGAVRGRVGSRRCGHADTLPPALPLPILYAPAPPQGPAQRQHAQLRVRRGGVPRAKHASSTRQSVADADGVRDRGASEAGRRGRRAPHLLRVCPLLTPFHSPPPSLPTPPVSPLLLLSAALESGYRQFPRTGHAGGPQNPLVRWPRCTRKSAGSTRWTSPRGTGRRREVRLRLRRVRCVRACAALGSAVCGKGVCAQCARSAHAPCTRAAVAWAELGGASRERESAPPTRARR